MPQGYSTDLPDDYDRLIQVGSLSEMFDAVEQAGPDVNIIVWRRGELAGDFNTLSRAITSEYFTDRYLKSLNSYEESDFLEKISRHEEFSPQVETAALQVANDIKETLCYMTAERQRKYMACITAEGYRYKDTHLFHSDGAVWRLLAAYTNPATEWIRNEDSVLVGKMGQTPIYDKAEGALTYQFQPGDIWVHAGDYRDDFPAFLHKAPEPQLSHSRLLVTSDLNCGA